MKGIHDVVEYDKRKRLVKRTEPRTLNLVYQYRETPITRNSFPVNQLVHDCSTDFIKGIHGCRTRQKEEAR